MANDQDQSSYWNHQIKLIYISGKKVLNQFTVSGVSGNSFNFKYYRNLGLPRNYRLDYVSGKLPVDFDQDSKIKIYVAKKGVHKHSSNSAHKDKSDYGSVPAVSVVKPHRSRREKVSDRILYNYNYILQNTDPYGDVDLILLALGYSISAIGQAIQRLYHE